MNFFLKESEKMSRNNEVFMKFWIKKSYGFSLIELLIVIAIITILVAVGMSSYQRYIFKSRTNEAKAHLSDGYISMKTFFADQRTYTSRFDAVGFNPEGSLYYRLGFTSDADPGSTSLGTATCYDTINFSTCSTWKRWTSQTSATSVGSSDFQGGAVTQTSFSMGASAILKGTNVDSWSINQEKKITNNKRGF